MSSSQQFSLLGLLMVVAAFAIVMALGPGGGMLAAIVMLFLWTLWSDRGPKRGESGYIRHQVLRAFVIGVFAAFLFWLGYM